MNEQYDVVIIGGGLAGLYTSLILKPTLKILVLVKDNLEESNSFLAQGGIAVALSPKDSPKNHFTDTMIAGAGICEVDALRQMVYDAAENIKALQEMGVVFDREDGQISMTREGGHSKRRILHIDGDATGRGLMKVLLSYVRQKENITIKENCFTMDLLVDNHRCIGVIVLEEEHKVYYYAQAVVLATGGIGMVYGETTNSLIATGDGIAMSYRAGALIKDMEFIQFHPTVFHNNQHSKRFLISEAVRGEGAYLRNRYKERFMKNYDPQGELAPRDIVARAIVSEMKKTDSDFVYLDVTHLEQEVIAKRFPNIAAKCLDYGIDITKQMIPVSPAQHYCMGGVQTDLYGRTSIPGLYACGETAWTGVHGANRLASNSLLESVVFGQKVALKLEEEIKKETLLLPQNTSSAFKRETCDVLEEKMIIQATMRKYAGIIRTQNGLKKCLEILNDTEDRLMKKDCLHRDYLECRNMLLTAKLIAQQALLRQESIGAHYISKNIEES